MGTGWHRCGYGHGFVIQSSSMYIHHTYIKSYAVGRKSKISLYLVYLGWPSFWDAELDVYGNAYYIYDFNLAVGASDHFDIAHIMCTTSGYSYTFMWANTLHPYSCCRPPRGDTDPIGFCYIERYEPLNYLYTDPLLFGWPSLRDVESYLHRKLNWNF